VTDLSASLMICTAILPVDILQSAKRCCWIKNTAKLKQNQPKEQQNSNALCASFYRHLTCFSLNM